MVFRNLLYLTESYCMSESDQVYKSRLITNVQNTTIIFMLINDKQ
jgi:hypothetical protein